MAREEELVVSVRQRTEHKPYSGPLSCAVGWLRRHPSQVRSVSYLNAEEKAADMNAEDVEAIERMVAGTARSMGVEVEG